MNFTNTKLIKNVIIILSIAFLFILKPNCSYSQKGDKYSIDVQKVEKKNRWRKFKLRLYDMTHKTPEDIVRKDKKKKEKQERKKEKEREKLELQYFEKVAGKDKDVSTGEKVSKRIKRQKKRADRRAKGLPEDPWHVRTVNKIFNNKK